MWKLKFLVLKWGNKMPRFPFFKLFSHAAI